MSRTEEPIKSEFTVRDIVNNDVWLQDSRRGLTVAVEATSPCYNSRIKEKIRALSEGDVITAELRSQNALRTVWVFDDVKFEATGERRSVV